MSPEELQQWFDANKTLLETAYLTGQHPWQQSGFGLHSNRTAEQWEACRRPIAECLDKSGTFLDIGCANGYLLESIVQWARESDIEITPYGLDLSDKMVALAQERLPEYAHHMFVGNAWDWAPLRTFDYVRTELVYVPDELHQAYVTRLLDDYLRPEGKLLITEYRNSRENNVPALTIDIYLAQLGLAVDRVERGYLNGLEMIRVAVLSSSQNVDLLLC